MGSSTSSASPSAAFLAAFRARAGGTDTLSFAEFMALALYDPMLGYYRRDRPRVGIGAGTDFYTASTSGPIFGELIAAACIDLLAGQDPATYTFVEVGAEPTGGVLTGVPHPFGATHSIRVGEPISLSGRLVVFSNELFDAQPFRRFVRRANTWRELGVTVLGTELVEVELSAALALPALTKLPTDVPDGYVIDAPLAAATLAQEIAAQPWKGLFVACDYGKSWAEIARACPIGTARAYFQHTQSNDLLACPGEQDLTCHVCWDWLSEALSAHGFAPPRLDSQESFLIRHGVAAIAAISTAEAAHFSRRKLSLLQLLHPSHLGQKFQVLHARRDA